MKLSELVRQGYAEEHDLNCAETMLRGANEVYGLGLDAGALKLAAGFGGGMGIESTCGALIGGVMVLGGLFTRRRGHDSPRLKELCAEFLNRYRLKMGAVDCAPLKERYRSEETKCREVVRRAAETLEEIVSRELPPAAPGAHSR